MISNLMLSYKMYLETAINIGYSCQLLTDELVDVFIVDASSYDEVHKQLLKFRDNIKIVNTFQPVRSPAGIQLNSGGQSNGSCENNHSTGTSTPPQQQQHQHQQQSAPAVSVVTFRWDDENYEQKKRAR